MELLLWMAVEGINGFLAWLSERLAGWMPGQEVHFWAIGTLGMLFFFVAYVLVKVCRKIPFGDTALAFVMGLTFVSGAVLATGMDEVATEKGTTVLVQGAAGLTGFFVLFFLYLLAAAAVYAAVKSVKKIIRRRKEKELVE